MEFPSNFQTADRANLEDVCIIIRAKAGTIESASQKSADRNLLADGLVDQKQPRLGIVKTTDHMRLKRFYSEA